MTLDFNTLRSYCNCFSRNVYSNDSTKMRLTTSISTSSPKIISSSLEAAKICSALAAIVTSYSLLNTNNINLKPGFQRRLSCFVCILPELFTRTQRDIRYSRWRWWTWIRPMLAWISYIYKVNGHRSNHTRTPSTASFKLPLKQTEFQNDASKVGFSITSTEFITRNCLFILKINNFFQYFCFAIWNRLSAVILILKLKKKTHRRRSNTFLTKH